MCAFKSHGKTVTHHHKMLNKQRGSILLFVVVMTGILLVLAHALVQSVEQHTQLDDPARRNIVMEAARAIQSWYSNNALSIDGSDSPIQIASLEKVVSGISGARVQLAVSNRLGTPCLSTNCVAYRVIVIWLPPESSSDTSSFDVATGMFTPAPGVTAHSIVDGRAIQNALQTKTLTTMNQLAAQFEMFAATRQRQANANSALSQRNYFRPEDCNHLNGAELPCYDTYQAFTQQGTTATGIDPTHFVTAWGSPILISNLQDASTSTAPFTLRLRAISPWGSTLDKVAIQPL